MDCGVMQKTLLEVLAESLYVDENGTVYLNTTRTGADCETITPLIACGNSPIDYDALIAANISGSDPCGNTALKLLYAAGMDSPVIRTVTESGNMLMSDEVIVCDSPVDIDFYLLAASASGRQRHIKNIGAGIVTVSAGLGTLDGQSSVDIIPWNKGKTGVQDYSYRSHKKTEL